MRNCPNCGAQLPGADEKFCTNCGQPLGGGSGFSPKPPPAVPSAQAPVPQSAQAMAQDLVRQQQAAPPPAPQVYRAARPATPAAAPGAASNAAPLRPSIPVPPPVGVRPASPAPAQPQPPETPQQPPAENEQEHDFFSELPTQPPPQQVYSPRPSPGGPPKEDPFAAFEEADVVAEPEAEPAELFDEAAEAAPQQAYTQQQFYSPAQPQAGPRQTMPPAGQEDLFGMMRDSGSYMPNVGDTRQLFAQQAPPPQVHTLEFGKEAMQEEWTAPYATGIYEPEGHRPAPKAARQPQRPITRAAAGRPAAPARAPDAYTDEEASYGDTAGYPAQLDEDDGYYLEEQPARSPRRTVLTAVIALSIFLFVTAAVLLVMLVLSNRPAKVIDDFATALSQGDAAALAQQAQLVGVEPTEAGWQAFIAAFSEQENLSRLRSQLSDQANDTPDTATLSYPAVGITSRPLFIFFQQYQVTITGVNLLVPGAASGTTVQLDGIDYPGQGDAQGLLLTALMPGRYYCRVVPPGADPASVTAQPIELFKLDEYNLAESADAARATITVDNCLSDDAEVYVNELLQEAKPVGGVLTLNGIAVGSVIRIVALSTDAAPMQSSVTFADAGITQLRFPEYTPVDAGATGGEDDPADQLSENEAFAAKLTPANVTDVLRLFYSSYLNCINTQTMEPMQLSTAANTSALTSRVTSPANAANTFTFVSVSVDETSMAPGEVDGMPALNATATFTYNYVPRDNSAEGQDATSTQAVQLVYDSATSAWLVNSMRAPE